MGLRGGIDSLVSNPGCAGRCRRGVQPRYVFVESPLSNGQLEERKSLQARTLMRGISSLQSEKRLITRNRGKKSLCDHRVRVDNPHRIQWRWIYHLHCSSAPSYQVSVHYTHKKSLSTCPRVQVTTIALGKSPGTQPNLCWPRVRQTRQCDCTATARTHTTHPRLPFRISRRSRRDTPERFEALHGRLRGKRSRRDPLTPTSAYGNDARLQRTTTIRPSRMNGNASPCWRGTKRSARASRTRGRERCLHRVAETRRYGYGKVIAEFNLVFIPLTGFAVSVKPDADFECMSVMMEHSQDVKCVAWHPTDEVVFALAERRLDADFFSEDRFWHRRPTTIRSNFTSTIHPMTGFASRRCPVTQAQCGLLYGRPAAITLPLPPTTSRSESGDGLPNTHGNSPIS